MGQTQIARDQLKDQRMEARKRVERRERPRKRDIK